jgi:hypothetical protein
MNSAFMGSCKQDPDKDIYNLYLSQLRIQIEMLFGLLILERRVLRRKLEMSPLENSARIIEVCARMHNYVLNCKEDDEDEDSPEDEPEIHVLMAGSPLGWGYLPTIDDFNSCLMEPRTLLRYGVA